MEESARKVAEILQEYNSKELDELILRMRAFANRKLGNYEDNHQGRQKLDFVFDVFQKALTNIRKWNKSDCSFEDFLFGTLRSEISAYHEKAKRRKPSKKNLANEESYILEIPVFIDDVGYEDESFREIDNKEQKERYVTLLEASEASDLEMLIFECWCDGIEKPKEIAGFLEVDITEVYNAIRRLERRRSNLNNQMK